MNHSSHILIVDDTRDNLKVVGNILKEEGYNIALALDGAGALKILESTHIDLILLDVMMPDMDGYEVCEILKGKEETKEIPVIFLTAKNDTLDLIKGFKVGGVDYISKPFNKKELLVRVKNHLELWDSKQRIIEMNNTRDKLYSIIAHDLRSPLASIKLAINALSEGYLQPDSEDFGGIVEDLKTTTDATYQLLTDLLIWTRAQEETISLNPKTLNISELISDSLGLLLGNAEMKNIALENKTESNLPCYIDEVTMHTVFRNLVSNAIKFTPTGGSISLNSIKDDTHIHISIQDTGVGMSEEIIKKILNNDEHFTSSGTNQEMGTGLGMIMVNSFIKKNNCTLQINSKPNEGTNCIISIPS